MSHDLNAIPHLILKKARLIRALEELFCSNNKSSHLPQKKLIQPLWSINQFWLVILCNEALTCRKYLCIIVYIYIYCKSISADRARNYI